MMYSPRNAATMYIDDWSLNRSNADRKSKEQNPEFNTITWGTKSLEARVEQYEKRLIQKALEKARGNQTKAAALLLTTKRVIQYKVKKYTIDYRCYRANS